TGGQAPARSVRSAWHRTAGTPGWVSRRPPDRPTPARSRAPSTAIPAGSAARPVSACRTTLEHAVRPNRLVCNAMDERTGLPAAAVLIVDLPASQVSNRLAEAMRIYVQAMGYPAGSGSQRGVHMLRHAKLSHFRCRLALDAHGDMLGFGYGYTSLPGQWWHDLVRRAVREDADYWLREAFELSELHVRPDVQGHGIGERMLRSLADGL